jgi:hypothetical protein
MADMLRYKWTSFGPMLDEDGPFVLLVDAEADDLTRASDAYTIGYATGQADMRQYLLADDTGSFTYGYREGYADGEASHES